MKVHNPITLLGRMKYLFPTVLSLIILFPFLEQTMIGKVIIDILFSGVFVAGLSILQANKKAFHIGLILSIPAFVSIWLTESNGSLVMHICSIIFLVFLISFILVYLVNAIYVTSDLLLGAVSLYLLIGLLFGLVFSLSNLVFPGSIASIFTSPNTWSDYMYFSFISLTTLGYGDFYPAISLTRMLVVIEVLFGQLYLTMLVANLVGIFISNRKKSES